VSVQTLTLSDLQTRCREAADMVGSDFVSDAELTRLINTRLRDYVHLISENESEEHGFAAASISAVTASGSLPADTYRVLHILRTNGEGASAAEPVRLERFPALNRGRVKSNDTALDLLIEYIARATVLVDPADTWSFAGDAEDYLVGWVAAKMLAKEESDPTIPLTIAESAEMRLRSTARRTTYDGQDFPDDRIANDCRYYWRLNGSSVELFRERDDWKWRP
jgi:hypothetical protein